MKKIFIFDYDRTLAKSGAPPSQKMLHLLQRLLENNYVSILTGGRTYKQLKSWVLDNLDNTQNLLLCMEHGNLLYYKNRIYKQESLSKKEREQITKVWEEIKKKRYGLESISERQILHKETMLSIACLGQNAPSRYKDSWDRDIKKRIEIREVFRNNLKFPVNIYISGRNSLDFVGVEYNKADNIKKLLKRIDIELDDAVYFGDEFTEFGNDYPITNLDIKIYQVNDPADTFKILKRSFI